MSPVDRYDCDRHRWFSWGDFEIYEHKSNGTLEIGLLTDDLEVGEVFCTIPEPIATELKEFLTNDHPEG